MALAEVDPELRDMIAKLARLTAASKPKRWEGYQRFRPHLGADQLGLIDDTAPLVAADPGRRAGKTTAFIGKLLRTFEEHDAAKVFYFAPTGDQGTDIIWESMQRYNREYDLGLREHWSEKWWALGTRKLEIFSFHDRSDVDRARGRAANLVVVDEAQLAPDWFAKQFDSSILPVTLDYRGQAWAIGTPAITSDGFFFDACHDAEKWSNGHHWTANENPFYVRAGRDALAEARDRFKLKEDSPTYQREWLGRWVVDPDALVYYIPDAAIIPKIGQWWANFIGLDLGWKDHDAIAVMGVSHDRATSHLRHMETKGQQTNHQLFARIKELAAQFPGPAGANGQPVPTVIYDPAGHATRKTIETFRSDAPGIKWVTAEKTRKVEFIEWLNNDLRQGTTTVEPGCSMIREAKRMRWKRPGAVAEDADHSDQGDAWLYAHRYARDFLRALPKPVESKRDENPWDEWNRRRKEGASENHFAARIKRAG